MTSDYIFWKESESVSVWFGCGFEINLQWLSSVVVGRRDDGKVCDLEVYDALPRLFLIKIL